MRRCATFSAQHMCSICVVVQPTPQSNPKEEQIQMAAGYVEQIADEWT
jgi:hypothetical protein